MLMGTQDLRAQGSPEPDSHTCVPQTSGPGSDAPNARDREPVFPDDQYPVKLPVKSLLGAPNFFPNPYGEGVDFVKLPAGRVRGSTASVTAAPDGTIWVMDRCGHPGVGGEACDGASSSIDPIFQFDTSGNLLKSFGAGLFVSPHKLEVDKAGNVWVADNSGDQVFKLDKDGKVLMTLGKKGVVGTGNDEFDAPTDIAFGANGTFFIADGHTGGGANFGNARIMKFDRNGRFLMSWGKKGMGPGEFDVPHALATDNEGRLYVADRQNNCIQVFDQNGKFIVQWFQFGRPSGISIDKNNIIYVSDSESRDGRSNTGRGTMGPFGYGFNAGTARGIRIGSVKDGKVKYFIPDPCSWPYKNSDYSYEGVTADAQGNVYGGDVGGENVEKYAKRK
jgi:DNA-binding beta-propeller fold protein YncE